MPKFKNLTSHRYGRLAVLERVGTKNTHPLWRCKCDCGNETFVTTNCLRRFHTQSCGCLKNEFLALGPHAAANIPRPKAVEITYPIPECSDPVLARRYQWRWERVERQARMIERGKWKEPEPKKWVVYDQDGRVIAPLDLLALAKQKKSVLPRPTPTPFVPSSVVCGASIADRIRVISVEELARL